MFRVRCEPLAANVAAVKEPTGVMAKFAAIEAGDGEVAEVRDGSAEMRERHSGHPAKRGGGSQRSRLAIPETPAHDSPAPEH